MPFTELPSNTDDNVNTIFTALYNTIMDYTYTSISDKGDETLDDLQAICDCLNQEGIPHHDENLIASSSSEKRNGRGLPFGSGRVRRQKR